MIKNQANQAELIYLYINCTEYFVAYILEITEVM